MAKIKLLEDVQVVWWVETIQGKQKLMVKLLNLDIQKIPRE
jgi:hypothetical protein